MFFEVLSQKLLEGEQAVPVCRPRSEDETSKMLICGAVYLNVKSSNKCMTRKLIRTQFHVNSIVFQPYAER
jgi:hypothetical protein